MGGCHGTTPEGPIRQMTPKEELILNVGATLVTLLVGGEFVALARGGMAGRAARLTAVSDEVVLWGVTAEVAARHAVGTLATGAMRGYVAYEVYVSAPISGAAATAVGNGVLLGYDFGRGLSDGKKLSADKTFLPMHKTWGAAAYWVGYAAGAVRALRPDKLTDAF